MDLNESVSSVPAQYSFNQMISRVLRKMFTNKYLANVPLQNCESAILGMMDTVAKHSQNFRKREMFASVCTCNEMKVGTLDFGDFDAVLPPDRK